MRARLEHHEKRGWDRLALNALIRELWSLRAAMLARESDLADKLRSVHPSYAASARNLAHYLALRRIDVRPLQERLASLGVSSLGRAESNVLANLDKVLGILHRLAGCTWQPHTGEEPTGIHRSRALLERHATDLLGAPPAARAVRIMVTLPSEAATDFGLVRRIVAAGMDIARINCAHDGPAEWERMASHVRRAARAVRRPVKILMDLGGPKLRTGPLAPRAAVIKLRPQRDDVGHVLAPARLGLRPAGSSAPVDGAAISVTVDPNWLARLKPGDTIDFTDARGSQRTFTVAHCDDCGVLVESLRTAYIVPATRFNLRGRTRHASVCGDVPQCTGVLRLRRGDMLHLTRVGLGQQGGASSRGRRSRPAVIACTLPEVLVQVRKGEHIWFDDGRLGGLVRRAMPARLEIEITHARERGEALAGDKGINLPDTALSLPALTDKDREDLAVVARHADLVGLSFVQRGADVEALRERLRELGPADLGVMLKIETRRGFENLPELLFAAMAGRAAGVMIARGDLAVECGFERLAEVQEEILWVAEAAHMPVVWATQVLETLAKTGRPSRAEITDAAMGERAECVMLNKGPHVLDAIHTLDDILRRMQAHQAKKRPLLRALRSWGASTAGRSRRKR